MLHPCRVIPLVMLLILGACSTYNPLIDAKGSKTPRTMQEDVMECRYLADQEISQVREAVVGGLLGAVMSAAIGVTVAVLTQSPEPLLLVAGIGATGGVIGGAGMGAINANSAQNLMVKKCLKGRGHSLLND